MHKAAAEKKAEAEKAAAEAAGLSVEIYRLALQLFEAIERGDNYTVTLLLGKDSSILDYQNEVRLSLLLLPAPDASRRRC